MGDRVATHSSVVSFGAAARYDGNVDQKIVIGAATNIVLVEHPLSVGRALGLTR